MHVQNHIASGSAPLTVLNIGCGAPNPLKLHPAFRRPEWREIRLDADPNVRPDIVADITNLRAAVREHAADAIFASHIIEHLYPHDASVAMREMFRVLKPGGFALLACPDLEAIARFILERDADEPAYQSPAGPITPIDMLWGHRASLERGNLFMAHRNGFTQSTMWRLGVDCGFRDVRVSRSHFNLWALLLTPGCDLAAVAPWFAGTEQTDLAPGAPAAYGAPAFSPPSAPAPQPAAPPSVSAPAPATNLRVFRPASSYRK